VITYSQSQVKKNTLISISNADNSPENLSKKNITVAFSLNDLYSTKVYEDPRYGKFSAFQYNFDMDEQGNRTVTTKEIPYSKCKIGENFFFNEEAKKYGIEQY
jgi:hypothetical protein